jgi:DNA-binding cell septation regulator SpoVG
LIAPDADYSTTGAPVFTDQKDISGWALNDCLYISKIGIIKGTNGMFMPRAITDAQKAIGYANTSREQALAMSVRIVEKMQE